MDPYKILNISRDATTDEIRKAYRSAAKKHHPDMGGEAWIFQQVQEAYESLANSKVRKKSKRKTKSNSSAKPKRTPSAKSKRKTKPNSSAKSNQGRGKSKPDFTSINSRSSHASPKKQTQARDSMPVKKLFRQKNWEQPPRAKEGCQKDKKRITLRVVSLVVVFITLVGIGDVYIRWTAKTATVEVGGLHLNESAPKVVSQPARHSETIEKKKSANKTENPAFSQNFAVGMKNEFDSRSAESKERLLREYGGSKASEEAVALALKWIVDHQLPDGGWNFDHRIGGGGTDRSSPDPGELVEARAGATAMALLPLLGNGQTHLTGKYKDVVRRGLEYLMARGTPQRRGAVSFMEPGGTIYSHGLAAIVFAEAFAMTEDPLLAPFAQGSIWFIEQAQDPVGGGWRYKMNQPGDTSAVGWQVMAIKRAKLAGFQINKRTDKLIDKFLNAVSIKNGSIYGYDAPPARVNRGRRSVTAIGLLCRMYMGWEKDHPGLKAGVEWLSNDVGPDVGKDPENVNLYYNYYGTQVMKQYGGEHWKKWNAKMRDYLVLAQDKKGAATGSWMFNRHNHSSERGGRLYCTAMACMTLEVYYRYLPLYRQR
jgi:curved DNA-binding protein CbpA